MIRTRRSVVRGGMLALTAYVICSSRGTPAMADESWKLPLEEKARILEQNARERHWIDGLYPSSVEVPWDGSPVDQTTSGSSNVAHAVNWTSYHLAGECFHYLFTQDEAVREQCSRIFRALHRLQAMTGVRGLLARGYALGHGESYEEREGARTARNWHQGVPPYQDYRWRGTPSHHSYSSAAHAFGLYYVLLAQGEEKEMARDALDAIVSYWLDNGMAFWDEYHENLTPFLGLTDGKTPNTRVLMAVSALRMAAHATGQAKFREAHDRLVEQYGLRGFQGPIGGERDFDDTNHLFHHLEVLLRIEDHPLLRAFWEHVADRLWQAHRDDRQSLFTYIYFSLRPQAEGKEKALQEALWTLQSYPTDKIFRPRMNSLRTDIDKRDGRAARPLPLYESPWDNEYQWKGSLYTLDGWFSRPLVALAASPEDPTVLYAVEATGDLYQSRDGAASGAGWRRIRLHLPDRARHIAVGARVPLLYLAADNGLYRSTTAGVRWERLPLPEGAGAPQQVLMDPGNPNVLYVVADGGIYRSLDLGEEWVGARWQCLTENLPPAAGTRFLVAPGTPVMLYAVLNDVVWSCSAEDEAWQRGARLGLGEYGRALPWLVADPSDPRRLYAAFRSSAAGQEATVLQVSEDGGQTFSNSMEAVYRAFSQGGMAALAKLRIGHEITQLAADPHRPGTLYAATPQGVLLSRDSGANWALSNQGLDLPPAYAVFAPAHTQAVYASTLGGLFASDDGGVTWRDAHLKLIFEGNSRRQVGGADYLDAYWRARYFGFISDIQAHEAFWEKEG